MKLEDNTRQSDSAESKICVQWSMVKGFYQRWHLPLYKLLPFTFPASGVFSVSVSVVFLLYHEKCRVQVGIIGHRFSPLPRHEDGLTFNLDFNLLQGQQISTLSFNPVFQPCLSHSIKDEKVPFRHDKVRCIKVSIVMLMVIHRNVILLSDSWFIFFVIL